MLPPAALAQVPTRENKPLLRDVSAAHALRARNLQGAGTFNELERSPEQFEILFVVCRISPVDLNPFLRTCYATGLKRDNVAP